MANSNHTTQAPKSATSIPIRSLLVANRGEIAERVFHTCRTLGIRTIAVHSTPDAAAPFVHAADVAIHLPGASPAETYLRADLIIDAAKRAGADAIHPGYGFLSENADFAAAVQAAGLIWVGPAPEAIRSMGSKLESKELMAAAGVPVLQQLDIAQVTESDLPVLMKASSGGGGRGMRIVHNLGELDSALESARAEAASAFGDDTVFCEPYLPTGHHIEVQVLADQHGTVWALGERECSIQRRHQKIVEETPSPLISRNSDMRDALLSAATNAASAIQYEGAGTVEFLATDDGRFFFLEMNTRLQVEHPVTECVWGVDLVAEQIRIAEGAQLGEIPEPVGHAIEVRLYAEDPAANWQPQHGRVHEFALPLAHTTFDSPLGHAGRTGVSGVRVDSAIAAGSDITTHYDPMIAKIIATGATRTEAVRRLSGALRQFKMHGPVTNRDTLLNIVEHPAFIQGLTPTSFLDDHGLDSLTQNRVDTTQRDLATIAAALADAAANRDAQAVSGAPLRVPSGWRNVRSQSHVKAFIDSLDGRERTARYHFDSVMGRWVAGLAVDDANPSDADSTDVDSTHLESADLLVLEVSSSAVTLESDGVEQRFNVSRYSEPTTTDPHNVAVFVDTLNGPVKLVRVPRFPLTGAQFAAGTLQAPMPGMVARIAVSVGDQVTARQPLLWIEAMKMEHQILAPTDGVVTEIFVTPATQVDEGQVLIHIEETTDGDTAAADDTDDASANVTADNTVATDGTEH